MSLRRSLQGAAPCFSATSSGAHDLASPPLRRVDRGSRPPEAQVGRRHLCNRLDPRSRSNSKPVARADGRSPKDSEREFREVVAIDIRHEKLTVELTMVRIEGAADLNCVVVIAAKLAVALRAQDFPVEDAVLCLVDLFHRPLEVVIVTSHHVARKRARNDVSLDQITARTIQATTQHDYKSFQG